MDFRKALEMLGREEGVRGGGGGGGPVARAAGGGHGGRGERGGAGETERRRGRCGVWCCALLVLTCEIVHVGRVVYYFDFNFCSTLSRVYTSAYGARGAPWNLLDLILCSALLYLQ